LIKLFFQKKRKGAFMFFFSFGQSFLPKKRKDWKKKLTKRNNWKRRTFLSKRKVWLRLS